ncbi:MAG: DNA repair protein RadA, partial [Acidobacteriota bacterium]
MKPVSVFVCQSCGSQSPKWLGRCPGCGEWNSLVEEAAAPSPGRRGRAASSRAVSLADVRPPEGSRLATGNAEV